jgi:PadR family transcriptional regulator PadR
VALRDERNLPVRRPTMARSLGITSLKILAAIRDGVAYGLDIVARTGMPSGTVYPTLGRLKRAGLVTSRWEDQRVADREGRPRRRYYELSRAGAEALAEGSARVASLASELGAEPAGRAG